MATHSSLACRFGMCGIAAQLSPVPDSSGIQVWAECCRVLPPFLVRLGPAFAAPDHLRKPAAYCPPPWPLQLMQADTFDLHSFHTLTGTTFMLLAEPHTPDAAELLRST